MSANVPEMLDAWRMVAARRRFDGRIPLSAMTRLQGSLVDAEGECVYSLQFDQDDLLKVAYVELSIDVELPLACQRSLQRFLYPVQIRQRLGLIRDEADEAALPAEYEALLVPEDGMLRAVDMVEDELVLSVPVVPMAPGSEAIDAEWVPTQEEQDKASPFAALAALKKQ
ncbi:YceD family protein [Xanthomonas nasturtii]|uniref:Large ribosomal RNA subunit accumulation protein YceD n=1 Tax=Xanthomonas nasturtii TaxID=1843581 RepID=A0A3E1KFF0_9XANT|nr:YceD family protein [Xanthomonas nasturtii]MCL1504055.1 YceD family protein [Xanthomonas nasturtii]MCL1521286.1 YceD family protein [Xanthomonas nasturtii]MCL1532096.1 YceD family protein [Xanthomonas nasturtii]MCL1551704.1 YceD family protein [Xanthomonas nasturtii]MCL1555583.1 YceD family protein [Xanthomonas nasturtii]